MQYWKSNSIPEPTFGIHCRLHMRNIYSFGSYSCDCYGNFFDTGKCWNLFTCSRRCSVHPCKLGDRICIELCYLLCVEQKSPGNGYFSLWEDLLSRKTVISFLRINGIISARKSSSSRDCIAQITYRAFAAMYMFSILLCVKNVYHEIVLTNYVFFFFIWLTLDIK